MAARHALASWPSPEKYIKQRVAAELEQAAAVGDGEIEERDEAGVDRRRQLLRTRLPEPGQSLRELGEARDVDEGDGALELLVQLLGVGADPLDGEPREVRRQGMADIDGGQPSSTRPSWSAAHLAHLTRR